MFLEHTWNTGRERLQVRVTGNDKTCIAFSVVTATVLHSAPFLVPIHSVAEVFFSSDRAFLFSVYLLQYVVALCQTPLLSLYSVTGGWLEERSPLLAIPVFPGCTRNIIMNF